MPTVVSLFNELILVTEFNRALQGAGIPYVSSFVAF